MAQIQRGFTFVDGGSGDADELHELVDDAIILPGFITEQAAAVPASIDSYVYYKAGVGFRKCTHAQLISAFPSDAAPSTYSLRRLGTGANQAAAGNDARFPAQVTGVRKGNGTTADTAAKAKDFIASVDLGAGAVIDMSAGNLFTASLTGNKTYTFSNGSPGATVVVQIKLNGHTATFAGPSLATVGSGTTFAYLIITYTATGFTGVRFNI